MKKFLAILLATLMLVSVVACGNKENKGTVEYKDPYGDITNYDEKSQAIYDDILGEFYAAYEAAKKATNVSERYALMAVAEAKLMEAKMKYSSAASN